jgi:hypothetical protein
MVCELLRRPGIPVAPSSRIVNSLEVQEMTRTLGAALGVVVVLLFFASLTIEQNRVLSMARATVGWQK